MIDQASDEHENGIPRPLVPAAVELRQHSGALRIIGSLSGPVLELPVAYAQEAPAEPPKKPPILPPFPDGTKMGRDEGQSLSFSEDAKTGEITIEVKPKQGDHSTHFVGRFVDGSGSPVEGPLEYSNPKDGKGNINKNSQKLTIKLTKANGATALHWQVYYDQVVKGKGKEPDTETFTGGRSGVITL